MTQQISLHELRRVSESLRTLKGRQVTSASMRSDLRQLRIELADGQMIVISTDIDEAGRPHLEVDVVHQPEDHSRHQLEVRFESA